MNGLAILAVLFGSVNVYRVPYIICLGLIIIALHQTIGPKHKPGRRKRKREDDCDKPDYMANVPTEDSLSSNNTGVGIKDITNNDTVEDLPFDEFDTEASESLSQSSAENGYS